MMGLMKLLGLSVNSESEMIKAACLSLNCYSHKIEVSGLGQRGKEEMIITPHTY
jgi:hypothetical protein